MASNGLQRFGLGGSGSVVDIPYVAFLAVGSGEMQPIQADGAVVSFLDVDGVKGIAIMMRRGTFAEIARTRDGTRTRLTQVARDFPVFASGLRAAGSTSRIAGF